jgi:hypothetical protein
MLATLLDELGYFRLDAGAELGRLFEDRKRYNAALREALAPVKHQMCEECQRRAETNPLRVLDCKVPEDQPIIDALPKIADFLDEDSRRTSPQFSRRSMPAACRTHQSSPRPRPRLLHPHHVRVHPTTAWARKTRCSAADATTA